MRWNWRTRISIDTEGQLVILHRNIPPADVGGAEYDGVEFVLARA